jgi:hypothetical protein
MRMRPPVTRLGRLSIVALVVLAVAACDSAGYAVSGINETDHDVIMRVAKGVLAPITVLVPQRSAVTVDSSLGGVPEQGWTVTVFDADCTELATVPFDRSSLDVTVTDAGEVEAGDHRQARPAGIESATASPSSACP